jgi:hydroxymethylpyrimidine/phosphomethylpyrimidine kinase
MIANARIAEAIAGRLRHHGARNVMLDPVIVAKSGHALLDADAVAAVREMLVPLATLITPNLPEAAVLLEREDDWTIEAMHLALPDLLTLGISVRIGMSKRESGSAAVGPPYRLAAERRMAACFN